MTVQETVSFAGQFFASIWSFIRGVEVPFMQGVSVAGLMVGLFVARLGLKLVLRFLGMDADTSGVLHAYDRHNKIESGKGK